MTQTPNFITPRQFAVAAIAKRISEIRKDIEAHDLNKREDNLFNSQIKVFLEQAIVELKRAARHIELIDASEESP